MNRLEILRSVVKPGYPIAWAGFGLLAGIVIGLLAAMAKHYVDSRRDFVVLEDLNSDGTPDSELIYKGGFLVRSQYDRNFDGKPDLFQWYENELIARAETDDNFDGSIDGWATFRYGESYITKYDTDGNGVPDLFLYSEHGVMRLLAWRPNEAQKPIRIEVYEGGLKVKELRDTNGIGAFDAVITFDHFGLPVTEESLIPALSIEDEIRKVLGQR
jgi:hypothetical protein